MDIFFRKKKQDALLTGLFKSDLEVITQALKKIKNVNFVITNEQHEQFSGLTPLALAVYSGQLDAVQLLLQQGANPNAIVLKDPSFAYTSVDLLPCSPLYLTLLNYQNPKMEDIYQLLRTHHADMFCNKTSEPDYGLINTTDDVHFAVQKKLEKFCSIDRWQKWEENYQSARVKKMLNHEIGEHSAPVRKSKM